MRARYQPAELEIILDESRIARASIDSYSVRVAVGWRVPEATPPILATLENLPASMELVTLRRDDGEMSWFLRPDSAYTSALRGRPFSRWHGERPAA